MNTQNLQMQKKENNIFEKLLDNNNIYVADLEKLNKKLFGEINLSKRKRLSRIQQKNTLGKSRKTNRYFLKKSKKIS